jgi:hypothetical protein
LLILAYGFEDVGFALPEERIIRIARQQAVQLFQRGVESVELDKQVCTAKAGRVEIWRDRQTALQQRHRLRAAPAAGQRSCQEAERISVFRTPCEMFRQLLLCQCDAIGRQMRCDLLQALAAQRPLRAKPLGRKSEGVLAREWWLRIRVWLNLLIHRKFCLMPSLALL